MPSSDVRYALACATVIALVTTPARADAQQQYQGFAVERFLASAPGAGWFVMDALDMRGRLSGAMALYVSYARNPLRLDDGSRTLAAVSDQATAGIAAAVTFGRMRFSLDLTAPITMRGQSGSVAGYSVAAPSIDLASNPDTLSDARIGFDARILGGPESPFRLGGAVALFVPNGNTADFDTDGTFRGTLRLLFAGDIGPFSYAGHLGVHLRLRDDSPAPSAPHGRELLFGLAAGVRLPVGRNAGIAVIVGPELFGASALQSIFAPSTTALEALLGSRIEGTATHGMQLRFKAGVGAGVPSRFGAPEWRVVVGVEVFNRDLQRAR